MKSKIKTIILSILVFSLIEFVVYISYSIWDIADGISGYRYLTEQEISDISISLSNFCIKFQNYFTGSTEMSQRIASV